MAVHGYLKGHDKDGELAIRAYAPSLGISETAVRWHIETSVKRFGRAADRAVLSALLRQAHKGDVVICHRLADIVDLPSDLARLTNTLRYGGVDLQVVELARADKGAACIAVAECFAPIEQENVRLQNELDGLQARADQMLQRQLSEGLSAIVAEYGPPKSWADKLPQTVGDLRAPVERDASLGQAVKLAREAKGLSQRELGEMFGATQGSASRWESGDRGVPPGVLQYLFGSGEPQGESIENQRAA